MKFVLFTLALAFTAVGDAHSEATTALLHKYRCYTCHADREPGAGPAYVDVATRYRGTPNALGRLVATITKGARNGGPWHMPPHPEVTNAEASQMARYILSLRVEPAHNHHPGLSQVEPQVHGARLRTTRDTT